MAGGVDYAECERLLKEGGRDQWLASLFAPADKRPHLHVLHAFCHEIERIGDIVRDPMPGEIRLQWWRDAVSAGGETGGQGHPVADALRETMQRFKLPLQPFLDLIDAHNFDLYCDPMPDTATLEGYCGECFSAPLWLAALVRAEGAEAGGADAAGHAGVTLGLTHILRRFAWDASRGRVYVPGDILARHGVNAADCLSRETRPALLAALADARALARGHLAKARTHLTSAPIAPRSAYLALALVEPTLRLTEKPGYDPFRTPLDLPQWRRQWALWRGKQMVALR